MVRDKDLHPIHPGEMLREELLKSHRITPQQLAKIIDVEEKVVVELIQEKEILHPDFLIFWVVIEE